MTERQPREVAIAQLRDDRQPGRVELACGRRRPPSRHVVGLFDKRHAQALDEGRSPRRNQVSCADPAAGAVTEHDRTTWLCDKLQVGAGEAMWRFELDGHRAPVRRCHRRGYRCARAFEQCA